MPTQLLFYEAAVPLSGARHRALSIDRSDYSFSRAINSVPLTTVEFAEAASEYAIVFAGQPGSLMPAAVLGVRPAQNLFLTAAGTWAARYVPAFVRRYPFVFSSPDRGRNFTLCVDETYAGFNRSGRGERLFAADGQPSAYTQGVLAFLKQYQIEFQRTQAFCRRLEALDLLEPMQARITVDDDEPMALGGFRAVDRKKLKALAPAELAELAAGDGLEWIYMHLQSMRNFGHMPDRLGASARAPRAAGKPGASRSRKKRQAPLAS
jgi:hypothetical protein